MNSEEREIIKNRIKELKRKWNIERDQPPILHDPRTIVHLEGNIGALEWCLREFPDERHITGRVCANCSGG